MRRIRGARQIRSGRFEWLGQLVQDLEHQRIEPLPRIATEPGQRFGVWSRAARRGVRELIVTIRHGQDPRAPTDALAPQTARTVAVPVLLALDQDLADLVGEAELADRGFDDPRVHFDLGVVVGEPAHVMQQRGLSEPADLHGFRSQPFGEGGAECLHAPQVAA